MKTARLLLAALLTLSALPLRAQVVAAPGAKPAPKKVECPCSAYGYKPLTDKARAVDEYWKARRKAKISAVVSGFGLLFGMAGRSPELAGGSLDSYNRVRADLDEARARAVELKALRVTGDDLEDGSIEFLIEKGVDYEIAR